VGTVHSAKGETHLAALYVEMYYNKQHESERLSCCFCGKAKEFFGDHGKESARIAYVAMSRPTHLLCFAIHREHFEHIKGAVDGWKVVEL
jgi:DNA helicase II / ATP-dependent DNA helicase PcrA